MFSTQTIDFSDACGVRGKARKETQLINFYLSGEDLCLSLVEVDFVFGQGDSARNFIQLMA